MQSYTGVGNNCNRSMKSLKTKRGSFCLCCGHLYCNYESPGFIELPYYMHILKFKNRQFIMSVKPPCCICIHVYAKPHQLFEKQRYKVIDCRCTECSVALFDSVCVCSSSNQADNPHPRSVFLPLPSPSFSFDSFGLAVPLNSLSAAAAFSALILILLSDSRPRFSLCEVV